MSRSRRLALGWLAVGVAGFALAPWYAVQEGLLAPQWLGNYFGKDNASALIQVIRHGRAWLLPVGLLLVAGCVLAFPGTVRGQRPGALIAIGPAGLLYLLLQGFAIGPRGPSYAWLQSLLPGARPAQAGMGLGAALAASSFAMLFGIGLAARGRFKGDPFVACSVVAISLLLAAFTFYPVLTIFMQAVQDAEGMYSVQALAARLATQKIWSVACIDSASRCGIAWNTLILALLCASIATALGLAFALIVTRTPFRYKKLLRMLSVLPIITPPFVIGLGLILIFGRSGIVNHLLEWAFHIEPTRWIYGLPGVLLAQVFAFTPIAFLVLIGVVEGVAPSMEEAAQTLRANRWRTFLDISLPLMRPGLANAFLITFIESIADFGNPLVLGGNFGVLSTEVFFSVVGAQLDPGRAAALGILLLLFALAAFLIQRRVLGRSSYASVTGKGDAGVPAPLPAGLQRLCAALAAPWIALTIIVYAMALGGGFVELWGRDYTPTLRHYVNAFGMEWGPNGVIWTGAAWNSFWTTVKLSAIGAPLTAALGLLAAYLLTRQRFAGQSAFEFGTMMSFAIPGTVIGVSYILAFNVPPIEITGTALILVVCNVFRNMPVGVRAGIASMAQIDRSLDEASATLGARGFTVLRTVLYPLLKPAVVAALVYSFVRAMTTVSAVIFLVSARYEWATTYIINRVVNGDYGIAIAYSSVLIVLMLAVIGLIQMVVGQRRLGRRLPFAARTTVPPAAQLGTSAA
ncbi:MAG TPA: iron ABC transporter permease [Casimicrobiaceae bacterium]|nr:iron ABC transporter permease [Casimicrobiaceae bacterium]